MYQLVIVDDERIIAEGIAALFPWEQIGFEAVSFHDPVKALAYVDEHKVDVLMSDIEMPEIDGIEICRRMQDRDVKMVLISSHQNYDYFRSAIQYHVDDYILKPINSSDILTCFEKIKMELDQKNHVEEKEKPAGYYEKIIHTIQNYLNENYKTATLEEAAVKVNLSQSYLSTVFKEHSGMGFGDWLTMVRMKKACELLEDIQYKSYEIAYFVGYDNSKSFSRAFKNYYGITPTEYRNGKGISENER